MGYRAPMGAVLRKPNGTYTSYLPTADTDAARGTAILAAQTAAVAGDLIEVHSDASFTGTTSLGKNGVDWWIAPGVTLTHAGAAVWATPTTPTSYDVGGYGRFVCTLDGTAVMTITTAGSEVHMVARSLVSTGATSVGVSKTLGTLWLTADLVSCVGYDALIVGSTTATDVDYVDVQRVVSSATGADADSNGLECAGAGTVYARLGSVASFGDCINIGGAGTLYLEAQSITSTDNDAVSMAGTGTVHVRSGVLSSHASFKDLVRTTGTLKVYPNVGYTATKTTGTITTVPAFGL